MHVHVFDVFVFLCENLSIEKSLMYRFMTDAGDFIGDFFLCSSPLRWLRNKHPPYFKIFGTCPVCVPAHVPHKQQRPGADELLLLLGTSIELNKLMTWLGALPLQGVPGRLAIGFAESRPLSYPHRACDQENVKLQGQVKSKEGELQEQAGQKHLNTVLGWSFSMFYH